MLVQILVRSTTCLNPAISVDIMSALLIFDRDPKISIKSADHMVSGLQRAARATKKELRVKYKHDHCLNQKAAAANLLAPAIAM